MHRYFKKLKKKRKSSTFFYNKEIGHLLTEANDYFTQNMFDRSIERLKQAVTIMPSCHQAYYLLGLIYEEQSEFVEAYILFKMCLDIKKKDRNLARKLYEYSKMLNKKEDTLLFLEKMKDDNLFEEQLNLCWELNHEEKAHEMIIDHNNEFDLDFLKKLNARNLKKAVLKSIDKIADEYLISVGQSTCDSTIVTGVDEKFDYIMDTLYKDKAYDVICSVYAKCRNVPHNTKNKLIFAISGLQSNNYLFDCVLKDGNICEYDERYKDLFFDLGDLRSDVLEFLSISGSMETRKEALKKLANKSEECRQNHTDDHRCNLFYYLRYFELDPNDYQVRMLIFSIYKEQGNDSEAFKFSEISTTAHSYEQMVQFFKSVNDKRVIRYSLRECDEIRRIYSKTLNMRSNYSNLNQKDIECFVKINKLLLHDFFNNLFIFNPNCRSLDSYFTKNERCKNLDDLVYQSLHGLSVDEWYDVIKTTFLSIVASETAESFVILYKSLSASIFKDTHHYFLLVFLLIKYATIYNSLEFLTKAIKKLYLKNTSAFNLYHFLLNFFPGYHESSVVRVAYNNSRRIFLRNFDKKMNPEDDFLFLSGNLHPFLYTETLDKIDKIYQNKSLDEMNTILLSIIYFNNAKSRRISNRNYFIEKGFTMLKNALKNTSSNHDLITYNLGRAYHHFGFHGLAESYYKKCLNGKYKKLAAFNLILIYKSSKSEELLQHFIQNLDIT